MSANNNDTVKPPNSDHLNFQSQLAIIGRWSLNGRRALLEVRLYSCETQVRCPQIRKSSTDCPQRNQKGVWDCDPQSLKEKVGELDNPQNNNAKFC